MVFFTCNHCGSSLKKNRVEKHYATECRMRPSVSCMDCMKDFNGEDFKSHTKCITESQKYSGKPVDNNAMLGKGEKKQMEWVETVRNIIDTKGSSLTPQERQLLEAMKDFENIPRKKKKFENFLKNVVRRYVDPMTIDKVWAMLEEHKPVPPAPANKETAAHKADVEESKATVAVDDVPQEEKKSKKKSKKAKEIAEEPQNPEEENTESPEDSNSKKKKKKRKSSTANGDITLSESVGEEISQSGEVEKTSKKEKLSSNTKNLEQGVGDTKAAVVNGEGKDEQSETKLSKKEKRERKKKQKYESELESITKEKVALDNDVNHKPEDMEIDDGKNEDLEKVSKSKKNKKQKNKEKAVAESVDESSGVVSEGTKGKDKKKGKRKHNGDIEEDCGSKKRAKEDGDVAEEDNRLKVVSGAIAEDEKPKGKFKWDKVILSVLQSVPDKELAVKRLRKKVLAEYQESLGSGGAHENSLEEALGMFERKLHKIPGVKVLKEKAKLVASS